MEPQARSLVRIVATEPANALPRRLGLVLSGGGGKGGAHLGVLDVLDALDVPIDHLTGASIGAVVAVLYAAGYSPDAIAREFGARTLRHLWERDPTSQGLSGARRLRAILDHLLGARTFADLALPCTVVATDLLSGRAVTLDRGPLVEALLATVALPGLFPPVAWEGLLLADGGIVNNLPVDVAFARGAGRVIAVDLSDPATPFAMAPPGKGPLARLRAVPQFPLAIATRGLTVLMTELTRLRLAQTPPDLLLRPSVGQIGTLDMGRIAAGYAAGVAAARGATSTLLALRDWRVGLGRLSTPRQHLPQPA